MAVRVQRIAVRVTSQEADCIYPGTSILFLNHSLPVKSALKINTKFQWEKHHSPSALVTRILKPLILFVVEHQP